MALALLVVLVGVVMKAEATVAGAADWDTDVTELGGEGDGDSQWELGEDNAPLDPFQSLDKNATKNATKVEDKGNNPFPAPKNGIKTDYDKQSGADGTEQNATNATAPPSGSSTTMLGEAASGSGSVSAKKYESLFMANGTMKAPSAAEISKATTILKNIKAAGNGTGNGTSPAAIAASIEEVASTIAKFAHANQEPKDSPHPGAPVNSAAAGSGSSSGAAGSGSAGRL